jgi:hypothetical protein
VSEPDKKFIDPKTGKPLDREWLDYEVENYITSSPIVRMRAAYGRPPRAEREVYTNFAPTLGNGYRFAKIRPSWMKKPRKVKRQMLAASLRRLIAVGKIRISDPVYPNQRSIHGVSRIQSESDKKLFGSDHDGLTRHYIASNVLDAIVDALGEFE